MNMMYTYDNKFAACAHLLLRWKGSIFKLVWPDLTVFLILYFGCSGLYRLILNEDQQRTFEKLAIYCEKYGTLIPVSFVLGFYVSLVIGRWWAQYKSIPWIDTLAIWVNASIKGDGDEERLLRRTICRYVCLSITQCFILISNQTKKRFPTNDHLITSGLLLDNERENMESIIARIPKYQTHWIPLVWASTIVTNSRADGRINSDTWMKAIFDEINKIKDQCNRLLSFDRIPVPLAYTQVVTLAVYSYFLSCLMGRQWLRLGGFSEKKISGNPSSSGKYGVEELDLILPVFTILQFLFYVGWLKVAENLINPFDDDDYDFKLNWMVDRHLQVAYSIVDNMHGNNPDLYKDLYWEEAVPPEMPHTIASSKYDNAPPESSTDAVVVSNDESEILAPSLVSIRTVPNSADSKFRYRSAMTGRKPLLLGNKLESVDEKSGGENVDLSDEIIYQLEPITEDNCVTPVENNSEINITEATSEAVPEVQKSPPISPRAFCPATTEKEPEQ